MCFMRYADLVHCALPAHKMGSGDFAFADSSDGNFIRSWRIRCERPARVPIGVFDQFVHKRQGGAAGRVEFVDVVGFSEGSGVRWPGGHKLGEAAVEREKEVDPHAEIGGPEHRSIVLATKILGFRKSVEPARGATYHGQASAEAMHHIIKGRLGPGEFYGHIGLAQQGRGRDIAAADNPRNFNALAFSDLFDRFAHFAVSKESEMHVREA